MRANPFLPKVRKGLLKRMEQDGCRTFSDKVRWVEDHIPSISDPASFVGELVAESRKNPHDPEYTVEMGEGAFSQVFAKPDLLEKFYRSPETNEAVDRGERAVETITRKQVGATEDGWGDSEGVDVSKMILCMARAKLRKDKDALAYLPTIHPVRIDYTDPDAPELVFTMPTYRALGDIPDFRLPENVHDLMLTLQRAYTGEGTMREAATNFERKVSQFRSEGRFAKAAISEVAPIKKVLETLHDVAAELPLSKSRADIHFNNMALDKDGHLIILDPMVAEMKFTQAEKLWKQLGWPGAK